MCVCLKLEIDFRYPEFNEILHIVDNFKCYDQYDWKGHSSWQKKKEYISPLLIIRVSQITYSNSQIQPGKKQ